MGVGATFTTPAIDRLHGPLFDWEDHRYIAGVVNAAPTPIGTGFEEKTGIIAGSSANLLESMTHGDARTSARGN